jgi:hypothetical protein
MGEFLEAASSLDMGGLSASDLDAALQIDNVVNHDQTDARSNRPRTG